MIGNRVTGHSADEIPWESVLLQLGHDALAQQLNQIRQEFLGLDGEGGKQLAPLHAGFIQKRLQVKTPSFVPENLEHAVSSTAKCIGIGGAARSFPLCEDAQQQFQTLC